MFGNNPDKGRCQLCSASKANSEAVRSRDVEWVRQYVCCVSCGTLQVARVQFENSRHHRWHWRRYMKKHFMGTALAIVLFLAAASVTAADFQDEWGPEVGSELPELTVKDTEGNDRTLEDLTGDNKGIVLFFVRTSNW